MANLTVPIFDKDDLKEIVDEAINDFKANYIPKKKIAEAIEEILLERDKSLHCEAIAHGWGLQSAYEILEKHLGEDFPC